jgi:C_GCAxxG_C_C family probable redox protein
MLSESEKKRVTEAGQRAVRNRELGYHCSESVFLAINETFQLVDPALVRMVTGFHGGGGTHATESGVDMTALLEERASGRSTLPPEEVPLEQVGHLCGALAAGIICIGLLYGRERGSDDLTCVDELCFELHRRFLDSLGARECAELFPKWKSLSPTGNCIHVYRMGAEIAAELILEAPELFPPCRARQEK